FRQYRNVDGTVTLYLLVRNNHVGTSYLDDEDSDSDEDDDQFIWGRRVFWPSEIKRLKEEWAEFAPLLTKDQAVKQALVPTNNPFDTPNFTWL
ncbi:MAG: hypothetical protein Q9170_004561, partial [Blastenia crenularia]